jgi:CheY-like chemotaxis protein
MTKILIIEDDQIVANIYRNKLSVEGYKVETAGDGEAGLAMIQQFKPDAVILDLMMPKLSGVEVMKRVRALPEFKSLPIVVFSNTYLTNMVQQAWKAGATKCLSKSTCSPRQLLDIISGIVGPAGTDGRVVAPEPAATVVESSNSGSGHAQPAASANGLSNGSVAQVADQSPAALRKSLLENFPATLSSLRALLQALIKASGDDARLKQLDEIRQRVHVLAGNAAVTDLHLIATVSDALEALLQELHDNPKSLNASTLRTVAGAIDFLASLVEQGRPIVRQEIPSAKILVVDDEPISRRAILTALERAKLKANAVDDPQTAYTLLSGGKYDLVFLDIDMPGMNGHELCSKMRALPAHQKTPVIFVTGLNGFEARTSSMMSGGSDFIAKPFVFLELTVKALVHILQAHIEKQRSTHSLLPA